MVLEVTNKPVKPAVASPALEPKNIVAPAVLVATQASETETQTASKPAIERVENTVDRLNQYVQSIERDLNFRVDDSSGKTIITVLDSKTEEIIRQIPAEHVLAFSENIESLKGILFSAEV
jgi:flagellar protein FlaG